MQSPIIQIDTLKPIGTLVDLTGQFNARVGDAFTPITIQWTEGGSVKNLDGLHPVFEAAVGQGHVENNEVQMNDDAVPVRWVGDQTSIRGYGQTILKLPPQVFSKSGLCYGYLALENDQGVRETSVDIWFKVLGGVFNMGLACNYFITDFQKALAEAKGNVFQTLDEIKKNYELQIQSAENAIDDNVATLKNLKDSVGAIQAQIDAGNVVTLIKHNTDIDRISKAIENKLAQMNLTPEAFANLDDLKARCPNGNSNLNVTVDNGHLYIWYDNAWKDCGQYQTAGLDKQVLDSIKNLFYQSNFATVENKNLINALQRSYMRQNARLNEYGDKIKLNQNSVDTILGIGSLQYLDLTDQNGDYILDENGNTISIQRWLPDTDKTLTQEGMPADAKAVSNELDKRFAENPSRYNFPTLYLYGDGITSLQSKKDSLTKVDGIRYRFPRFNLAGNLEKIKVQGASTATLPKKNWTITLDNYVEIFPQYGPQKKYVLKANMTDFSQLRNVGSAKLWGKIRRNRVQSSDVLKINNDDYLVTESGEHIVGESDPVLSIGGNFGAVDGFPIAVCVNDKYWGLYTFNLPKDKGMAKMGGGNTAIVSANYALFNKHTLLDDTDMCLEFCGRKDSSWVTTSINSLIDAIMTTYSDQDSFDKAVSPLLDLDSAIDYYVYTVVTNNTDGMTRNYLLQTFNGAKWYLVPYDLDLMFGRTAEFGEYMSPAANGNRARFDGITFENLTKESRLWYQLWKFHQKDIIARYKALATDVLASANIGTLFTNFNWTIPLPLIEAEEKLWPSTTHSSTNNLDQIRWWCTERISYLDSVVANFI